MTHHEELARIKKEFFENNQKTLAELKKLKKECQASNSYFTEIDTCKMCNIVVKALADTL